MYNEQVRPIIVQKVKVKHLKVYKFTFCEIGRITLQLYLQVNTMFGAQTDIHDSISYSARALEGIDSIEYSNSEARHLQDGQPCNLLNQDCGEGHCKYISQI